MSATCRVWLTELDKGREHYKDFNDKNKYTGWRSGLVKTAEIQDLSQLTFQVTVTIFEIYDQDGTNVTNKYIGLGIDSKQTITYLRKELQQEKHKVQQLTIQVDEYKHFTKTLQQQQLCGMSPNAVPSVPVQAVPSMNMNEMESMNAICGLTGMAPMTSMHTVHSSGSSSSMDSMMSSLFGSPTMNALQGLDLNDVMEHDLKIEDNDDHHHRHHHNDPNTSSIAIPYPGYGVHGDFDEEKSLTIEHRSSLSNNNGNEALSALTTSHRATGGTIGSGKVNSLSTGTHSIPSGHSPHSSPSGGAVTAVVDVNAGLSGGDVFKMKFKRWLCETVKLGQYLELFEKNECDDVRMIEFFEEKVLEKELGIGRTLHRKLIMKKAREHTAAMREFEALLEQDRHTKPYRESLEMHGIMNTKDLRESVSSKEELMAILGASSSLSRTASKSRRERQQKSMEKVWDFVQGHLV